METGTGISDWTLFGYFRAPHNNPDYDYTAFCQYMSRGDEVKFFGSVEVGANGHWHLQYVTNNPIEDDLEKMKGRIYKKCRQLRALAGDTNHVKGQGFKLVDRQEHCIGYCAKGNEGDDEPPSRIYSNIYISDEDLLASRRAYWEYHNSHSRQPSGGVVQNITYMTAPTRKRKRTVLSQCIEDAEQEFDYYDSELPPLAVRRRIGFEDAVRIVDNRYGHSEQSFHHLVRQRAVQNLLFRFGNAEYRASSTHAIFNNCFNIQ